VTHTVDPLGQLFHVLKVSEANEDFSVFKY